MNENPPPEFQQGDLVRPSRSYLRALGGTGPRDGLVAGWAGDMVVIAWNDDSENPRLVAPASLEHFGHKDWLIPEARKLLAKFRKLMKARGATQAELAGIHSGRHGNPDPIGNRRSMSKQKPRSGSHGRPLARLANKLKSTRS